MKQELSSTAPKWINLAAAAEDLQLRIPVWVSAGLCLELTGERTVPPDDPRWHPLLGQLRSAISEHFDGHSHFNCLESGIDFEVEISGRCATAFASLCCASDSAVIRLQNSEEAFETVRRRFAGPGGLCSRA